MIELNKENFESEVLQSKTPVFVDFWGDKCELCKEIMPFVHNLEEKYKNKIKFTSLNTSTERKLAISQRVLGLPTMIIYKGGEKFKTITPDNIISIDDVDKFINEVYINL